jgi:predicted Fe-Mo cluster-binding NifX family protein
MKVAVASDDGKMIAAHTGRCACFVIYDITDGKASRAETKQNSFTPHMRGEHGSHSHSPLIDALAGCEILIAKGMGPRLVDALTSANIKPIFTDQEETDAAAQQYAEGFLTELDKGTCDHSECG